MKNLFLLPILLLSLISCSSETDSVVERDGLYYEKFSETPFTGKFIKYDEDGQLSDKGSFKNGLREGEWVRYYDNGQLSRKGSYKNGKKEGEWVRYHENGQLMSRGSDKNGKREGEFVYYREDGTLDGVSGTYKNGKKVSD
jgi:antitoxin component YwqK of YwqJK toxin-antitoxin module